MRKFTLIMLSLTLLCASAALSMESTNDSRGAVLYKKHCSGCHGDAAKIKLSVNIVKFMRDPVPPMPSFSVEKITENDAQLIADFVRQRTLYGQNK
jgi:mono/diheme cytochrome c family protein